MLFNIINPSDPYTMRAVDLEIAAVAICLLGSGKYALEEIGGDRSGEVPFFILGGHDEWFTRQFDRDFKTTVDVVVDKRAEELVKSLASVFCGTPADKLAFDDLVKTCPDEEAAAELLLKTHDAKRGSDNDIGRHAWTLAKSIVEVNLMKAAEAEAAAATIQ